MFPIYSQNVNKPIASKNVGSYQLLVLENVSLGQFVSNAGYNISIKEYNNERVRIDVKDRSFAMKVFNSLDSINKIRSYIQKKAVPIM